ncbi:MAG TPA: hypothetical protein VIA18_27280 [Polyangia bacterium]|nr:hypothetical protein [Polyangia bacterium]
MRKLRVSAGVMVVSLVSLAGCVGPMHFNSRAGRVLETVTAVGAAAAGDAASHGRNTVQQPLPPLVP